MKTNIYFVPGLAANSKIFERLKFDEALYECHYLEWLIPLSEEETIEAYAKRMSDQITHENFVLIGVSFGGIMVQEMSKLKKPKALVIISSIKSSHELPFRLRIHKMAKTYKLFPANTLNQIDKLIRKFAGRKAEERMRQYEIYLTQRDPLYLKWAVYNVLHWQQDKVSENILHIHGDADHIFPTRHIEGYLNIKGGTHVMVLTKAQQIKLSIEEYLQKKIA
ncbi:alpha/beta hydrolase [Urechidicola sp. KH5]